MNLGGSHLVSGICLFDLAATFSCKLLCLGQQITTKTPVAISKRKMVFLNHCIVVFARGWTVTSFIWVHTLIFALKQAPRVLTLM
jgi:hypothetical protein